MVGYNARVGNSTVLGDMPDFIIGEKKDSVSGNGDNFFSLCQPMKLLGHCRYPKYFEIWIVHELGVFCDGLYGQGVDNTIIHFLNIDNAMSAIGRLGEGMWD